MAEQMNLWVTLLLIGVLTYGLRLSFIYLQGRVEMPAGFRRALPFVPIAVLSALIAPELLIRHGALDLSLGNVRLLAGLLSVAVAWRTRSVVLTIIAGMATLLILQVFLGG
jgi:branched-subunit amino acid transport protein